ncbi:MAG TPA: hypothetical protein VMF30_10730, partial [Pirellulales bacterium]|nr:hypothetical protein [Pirellulales bacterium]
MHRSRLVASLLVSVVLAWVANRSDAQTLTTLASFNGTNGATPTGDLTLSGSTLYGTTSLGGQYSQGTVFSISTTGGTPTDLVNFAGGYGEKPYGSLT